MEGRRVERSIGGELDKVLISFIKRGKKGIKNGRARKCYHQQSAINKPRQRSSPKQKTRLERRGRGRRERLERKSSVQYKINPPSKQIHILHTYSLDKSPNKKLSSEP
jgi:hypothetical protein